MEFVYVVERSVLFDLHFPQGPVLWSQRREEVEKYLDRIRHHGFYLERRKAEVDNRFKQIIPYVLVRKSDTLLLLERTDAQGERRLHGKRSIGIGGHIEPIDTGGSAARGTEPADVLLEGLRRELDEELAVEGPLRLAAAGFLNDDATAVGSVHFGFVAVADAGSSKVEVRETDKMHGRFVPIGELRAMYTAQPERFESWSGLLLADLDAVLESALPLERALGAGRP